MEHHFLGLDWGEAKIGVAVADDETRMAFGLDVLANNKELLEKLGNIIKEKNVHTVVIGIPIRHTSRESEDTISDSSSMNQEVAEYGGEVLGKQLVEKFDVKVEYVNEMFTTKMAREGLKEKGMKHLAQHDDQAAARIILQGWLDTAKK